MIIGGVIFIAGSIIMLSEIIYRSGGSPPLPTPYGRNKLQGHLSRLTLTCRIERISGLEVEPFQISTQ